MKSTKKERRHSGRTFPSTTLKIKKSEIINECLDPQEFWDDWTDIRDGFRGYGDKTKLSFKYTNTANYFETEKWNKRIKKLEKRRKVRLNSLRNR